MRDDLALDPLQRVVDRLRVAAELLGHVLVGRALEVEAQCVRLERRKARAEAEHQTLKLLGRDYDERRLVHRRPRQRVAERALALAVLSWPGGAGRDGRVERRVLEPSSRLDRGDDLARDAELGEAAERGLLVGAEVANRLVEADQPLLEKVVVVAAGQEVRARLETHEARVAADERVDRDSVAVAGLDDELQILELSLDFLRRACCRGASSHGASRRLEGEVSPCGRGEDSKRSKVLQVELLWTQLVLDPGS